ncbi:MAG: hypothetical protein Kow0031_40070 [Anaerolineae bacterium]
MNTQENTLEARDAYLKLVQSHLARWEAALKFLKSEERHLKPEVKLAYHHRVQSLVIQHEKLARQAENLHMAGAVSWLKLRATLDAEIAAFEAELEALQVEANEASFDALSWGQGMAEKKKMVDTLGWGEGQAHEESEPSAGWSEGIATDPDHAPHSIGWAEGMAHPDDEA